MEIVRLLQSHPLNGIALLGALFVIVWCLPNTMQLFRGSGAILHVEDYGTAREPTLLERRFSFRSQRP